MALSFIDNIDYRGKKPNFARDLFDTVADMVAFSENYLPDVFIACCKETGKLYMFNRSNPVDETLGKWREYISGSSTGNISKPISFYTDVGSISAGTTFPVGTSVEELFSKMGGELYTSTSILYYGVLSSTTSVIQLSNFTKVESSGTSTIKITCDGNYITFVSEKEITEIKDELGFPNDSEFTKSQKTISGKAYNVYISNYPITCTDFVYMIKI